MQTGKVAKQERRENGLSGVHIYKIKLTVPLTRQTWEKSIKLGIKQNIKKLIFLNGDVATVCCKEICLQAKRHNNKR